MADWFNSSASFDFELKTPEFIKDTVDTFNAVIEALITILDIALQVLSFAKAWLFGTIDPIKIIAEALLREVEEFINELLNAAFYITGDWSIYTPTFENYVGGFDAFESRIISKLKDTKDPTRPDIPRGQNAFTFIAYVGLDFTEVHRLLAFLYQFVRLFRINLPPNKPSGLRVPKDIKFDFQSLSSPTTDLIEVLFQQSIGSDDAVNISWKLPNPDYKALGLLAPIPDGFLVSVSTRRAPLSILYDRPSLSSTTQKDSAGDKKQVREGGEVLNFNKEAISIYGGSNEIIASDNVNYNSVMESNGVIKEGATRVFGVFGGNDTTPISLDLLQVDDKQLFQRYYYVSTIDALGGGEPGSNSGATGLSGIINLLGPNNPVFFTDVRYKTILRKSTMPYEADLELDSDGKVIIKEDSLYQPDTYYLRVFTVSERIKNNDAFRYLASDSGNTPGGALLLSNIPYDIGTTTYNVNPEDRGAPSEVTEVTFIPGVFAIEALGYLTAALAILVLSRSDMPTSRTTGFESGKAGSKTGLERFAVLAKNLYTAADLDAIFGDTGSDTVDIASFRTDLLAKCYTLAKQIYGLFNNLKPVSDALRAEASILLSWKWSDSTFSQDGVNRSNFEFPSTTILGGLNIANTLTGICKNPYHADIEILNVRISQLVGIEPGYLMRGDGLPSTTAFPVLKVRRYNNHDDIRLIPIRNIIPNNVYGAAHYVLGLMTGNITKPAQDGQWYAVRFSQMFPPVAQILDILLQWARTFINGLYSVVDALGEYIDFLESRILELQSLLNMLDLLLGSAFDFKIPRFSSLFLQSNGTDGIVNDLMSAGDKPSLDEPDPSSVYAGGVVVVLRGAPQTLINFIKAILS